MHFAESLHILPYTKTRLCCRQYVTKSALLLVLWLLPLLLQSQADNINFEHFTVRDGLPSQQVYNCFQDKEGFLWIGTDAGVSRFDGRQFQNFNMSDGLGDNEVHEIYQDGKGRTWFLPFSGKLSYFYKGNIYLQEASALLEGGKSSLGHIHLMEDAEGNVFITGQSCTRVMKLHASTAGSTVFDLSPLLKDNEWISVFYGSSKGQVLCVTTANRLLLLGNSSASDITPPHFLDDGQPLWFHLNHHAYDGYILFTGHKGLYKLMDSTAVLLLPADKMPQVGFGNYVQVFCDTYNNLWLNHLFHNTLFYKFSNGRYQEGVNVLSSIFALVACDRENNIWFATNEGLYRTTYTLLQDKLTFDVNRNLVSRRVLSCALDRDSGLWLGYGNGFVSRIKGARAQHYNLEINRRNNNRVVSIKADKAGNILIGTDESVFMAKRLEPGRYATPACFTGTNAPLPVTVKKIIFDPAGEAYVVEPFHPTLIRLNRQDLTSSDWHQSLAFRESRRFSSFFDSRGRLYTSTSEGFLLLEGDSLTDLAQRDPRLRIRVQDFAEGRDGTLFIAGYNNGLIVMRDRRFVCAMPRFNGSSLICRRLLLRNDTLYVATNYGVGVLTFTGNRLNLVKMLSAHDGLISTDVNDLVFMGNRLIIITSQGVSSFNPVFRPAGLAPPPTLLLQSIRVDDSLCPLSRTLTLSHKTRLVRISFIAPVLDKPELNEYRYRFNVHDEWQSTSANFIEFSKLKPGRYAIEIQAKKYNSSWSPSVRTDLVVTPPFYNTVWFLALVVLVTAGSLYFITRVLLQREYRKKLHALQKKEAVEHERNRIAADIHDDIGAELTNIALMSKILRYHAAGYGEEPMKIVDKIEASSQQVITKMNEVIWTLNSKNDSLKDLMSYIRAYITAMSESTGAKLMVHIDSSTQVSQSLLAEQRRNVFLVVKELLQNAVKHSGAGSISIVIHLEEPMQLCINYRDNGTGFDVSRARAGNGLSNIKRRVAESGGQIEITSAPGQGCTIKTVFPINTYIS